MAYCSYCAAILDPAQPVCARCGRPAPTAAPPASAAVTVNERPSSIRVAAILLLISCLISMLSLAPALLRLPPMFLVRTVTLLAAWIVLTILIWQRQAWARIAILVLIVWAVGNLLITSLRIGESGTLAFSLAFPLLIDALRIAAAYLLFKPESSTWFKSAAT
jgi:hypothetical protein